MEEVVIVEGVRTPLGTLRGIISDLTAADLGKIVVDELVKRTGIDKALVDEFIFGNCIMDTRSPNVARVIALMAGFPDTSTGMTIHQNCASGVQSIISAYKSIVLGDKPIVIAGGTESMSQAPFVNRDLRFGKKLTDSVMTDTLWEALTDPLDKVLMGVTAENIAAKFMISRAEQDAFAVRSHNLTEKATKEGRLKKEIVPIIKKSRKGDVVIERDEGFREGLTLDAVAKAPTVFKKENGTVTPANACPISDGASAVLMMTVTRAKELGLPIMGYVRSYATSGIDPMLMGLGPAYAIPEALKRGGLKLSDIDLFEVNEAFAAQILGVGKMLNWDESKLNVNGGAIAIGHPVGASGTRIVVTLLNEMIRTSKTLGVASLCVGGGLGAALVLERK